MKIIKKLKRSINKRVAKNSIHKARTAILLPGLLRSYKECAPFILKNIVEPLNADVFIYSPQEIDPSPIVKKSENLNIVSAKDLHEIYQDRLKDVVLYPYDSTIFSDTADKILTSLERDGFYDIDIYKTLKYLNPHRIVPNFYHLYQANNLKKEYEAKNGFTYDYVIKMRHDILPFTPVNLRSDVSDSVIIADGEGFDSDGRKCIGNATNLGFYNHEKNILFPSFTHSFNDQLFYSSSHNMDKVCDIFNQLNFYITELKVTPNNETLMLYHILFELGLKVRPSNFTSYQLYTRSASNSFVKRHFLPQFVMDHYNELKK